MSHTTFNSDMSGPAMEESGLFTTAKMNSSSSSGLFHADENFANNSGSNLAAVGANNINNSNAMNQMQAASRTKSKRRPSESRIVTGRSFKRLRLDHVHVASSAAAGGFGAAIGGGEILSTQSTGTLSVGTMGGDLESNDEDLGDEDDETLGAEGGSEEKSAASSWVASLGSTNNFRKRRMAGIGAAGLGTPHNSFMEGQYPQAQQPQQTAASQFPSASDEDDAATCSAMTTAAIAPRRRRHRYSRKGSGSGGIGPQKKRAIGFMMDSSNHASGNSNGDLVNGIIQKREEEEELELEDLDVPESLLASGEKYNHAPVQKKITLLPPIEQIPDPLLVAAQHAAVGGGLGMSGSFGSNNMLPFDNASAPLAPAPASGTVLLMNDCCSSVTEEETSLAEDEASLSAISIGANTTVSALSGGMDGSVPNAGTGSFDQITDKQKPMVHQQPDSHQDMMKSNIHQPPASAMKSDVPVAAYAPLNQILGGLHKERLNRLSMNRPMSRGDSSLHSMGSMGGCSGGGNSFHSLPNNLHNRPSNPVSWNIPINSAAGHHHQQQPFGQQQHNDNAHSMMDEEDAEMEEMDTTLPTGNCTPAVASAGSFGSASHAGGGGSSVASGFHGGPGSHASGGSVASSAAVADTSDAGSAVPKWKRRVNLATHSSLY